MVLDYRPYPFTKLCSSNRILSDEFGLEVVFLAILTKNFYFFRLKFEILLLTKPVDIHEKLLLCRNRFCVSPVSSLIKGHHHRSNHILHFICWVSIRLELTPVSCAVIQLSANFKYSSFCWVKLGDVICYIDLSLLDSFGNFTWFSRSFLDLYSQSHRLLYLIRLHLELLFVYMDIVSSYIFVSHYGSCYSLGVCIGYNNIRLCLCSRGIVVLRFQTWSI